MEVKFCIAMDLQTKIKLFVEKKNLAFPTLIGKTFWAFIFCKWKDNTLKKDLYIKVSNT